MHLLEALGIAGIVLGVIPFVIGVWLTALPVLSRFGIKGFLYLPIYFIYSLINHTEDLEYGFSLLWKSSILLIPSILLVQYF